jgi:hypothetical protein
MSNVTPSPWAIHDNGSYLDIGVPSGETRFPVYPTVMIGVDYGNKANADHIVKCVNYHERLVEVLTDLLEFEGSYSPCEIEMARAYAEAHKVLLEMQEPTE